jgi:hypothetical protein
MELMIFVFSSHQIEYLNNIILLNYSNKTEAIFL